MTNSPSPLTLDNLDSLENDDPTWIYLTSKDNITTNPTWLKGVTPDESGQTTGAVSCAIIVNDHGNGNVDVFYMYFYAYNWGGVYFSLELGDHVGGELHGVLGPAAIDILV